jgi:hypothetical protein
LRIASAVGFKVVSKVDVNDMRVSLALDITSS